MGGDGGSHCGRAVLDPLAVHADIGQALCGIAADDLIVINDQNGQIEQGAGIAGHRLLQLEINGHSKNGAAAVFTFYLDLAVHHLDDIAGDG